MPRFADGSYSTIVTPPSPAASGLTLTVATGHGARFAHASLGNPIPVTIWPADVRPLPTNWERGSCVGQSGDVLTLVRSASPRTILAGDQIAATITDDFLNTLHPGFLSQPSYGWNAGFNGTYMGLQGLGAANPAITSSSGSILSNPLGNKVFGGWPYARIAWATASTGAKQIDVYQIVSPVEDYPQLLTDPVFDLFFATGNETNQHALMKYWIGLFDLGVAMTGSSDTTPSPNYLGFRFSVAAGDANWKFARRDGTTQTLVDSGVAVAVNTAYRFRIRVSSDGTSVAFSINGGAETIVSTVLPAATVSLLPHVCVWKDVTGVSENRDFAIQRMVMRFGDPLEL